MAFSLLGSRQTRHPDFFRCEMDDFGGGGVIERTLIPADCVQAGNKFTPGGSVVSFKVGQNPWYEGEVANMVTADEGPYVLPWTGIDGKLASLSTKVSLANFKKLNSTLLAI